MLVVNVKRQSSLLTCPLQGLEVTTRRKTRWITYCSQVLKTSLFTWIVSFVTPASDTQPLQWWCEALGLEMLLTSRISQVATCRQIWESEYQWGQQYLDILDKCMVSSDSPPSAPEADTDDSLPLTFQSSHLPNNLNAEENSLAAHFWLYYFSRVINLLCAVKIKCCYSVRGKANKSCF